MPRATMQATGRHFATFGVAQTVDFSTLVADAAPAASLDGLSTGSRGECMHGRHSPERGDSPRVRRAPVHLAGGMEFATFAHRALVMDGMECPGSTGPFREMYLALHGTDLACPKSRAKWVRFVAMSASAIAGIVIGCIIAVGHVAAIPIGATRMPVLCSRDAVPAWVLGVLTAGHFRPALQVTPTAPTEVCPLVSQAAAIAQVVVAMKGRRATASHRKDQNVDL